MWRYARFRLRGRIARRCPISRCLTRKWPRLRRDRSPVRWKAGQRNRGACRCRRGCPGWLHGEIWCHPVRRVRWMPGLRRAALTRCRWAWARVRRRPKFPRPVRRVRWMPGLRRAALTRCRWAWARVRRRPKFPRPVRRVRWMPGLRRAALTRCRWAWARVRRRPKFPRPVRRRPKRPRPLRIEFPTYRRNTRPNRSPNMLTLRMKTAPSARRRRAACPMAVPRRTGSLRCRVGGLRVRI